VGDKRVSDMLLSDVLCTGRSNHQASPPPAGLSCCCCGLHLVQAFKAQIGHVGRSPVACPPPSPPTVTREPRVFLVCSSPMSSLVLPSLTPVLPRAQLIQGGGGVNHAPLPSISQKKRAWERRDKVRWLPKHSKASSHSVNPYSLKNKEIDAPKCIYGSLP